MRIRPLELLSAGVACQRAKFDPTQICVLVKLDSSHSEIATRGRRDSIPASICIFLDGFLFFPRLSSGLFRVIMSRYISLSRGFRRERLSQTRAMLDNVCRATVFADDRRGRRSKWR